MGTAWSASNLLAAPIVGLNGTQGCLTDEELFTLIALECGKPPMRVHANGKAPPLPGTTMEWFQRFVEICTVAGKTFEMQWQANELIEGYRHWYESQTRSSGTS